MGVSGAAGPGSAWRVAEECLAGEHRRILATAPRKVACRLDPGRALASLFDFWDDPSLPWPIDDAAMTTRQLLIGCVFALGGIGAAAAVEVDTQDLASSQHATVDVAASHEAGGSSDAPVTPTCRTGCGGNDAGNDAGNGSNEPVPVGATAHPRTDHRASLGWQSLLPGSIQ
jgi:hypothetical protein